MSVATRWDGVKKKTERVIEMGRVIDQWVDPESQLGGIDNIIRLAIVAGELVLQFAYQDEWHSVRDVDKIEEILFRRLHRSVLKEYVDNLRSNSKYKRKPEKEPQQKC